MSKHKLIESSATENSPPRKIFVKNLDKNLRDADSQSFFEVAKNDTAGRERGTSLFDAAAGDSSSWIVGKSASIHTLPYEILDHIFSYLTIKQRIQIELVCKRWSMINKNLSWGSPTRLVLDSSQDDSAFQKESLNDQIVLAVLSRCGIRLKHLTLAAALDQHTSLSNKSMKTVAKYCPNLLEVKLDFLLLTNQCLNVLAQGCSKLKSVILLNESNFNDEGLSVFLKRAEALESLEISMNYKIHGECFQFASKTLQRLLISNCPFLEMTAMQKLMARCERISELRFTYCDQLDSEGLITLLGHYKATLRVLHLDGYNRLINWSAVLSKLQHLEELSLYYCRYVTDKVLATIGKKCVNIRSLNVCGTDITDIGLGNLTPCQRLTVLDISEAHKIIGGGIEVLAAHGRLEDVYVRGCWQLVSPNVSCGSLARLCPKLRFLDVSGTTAVSNDLVETFQISIKNGFLKGNIKLVLGHTSVEWEELEECDRLELSNENTIRPNLFLDDSDDDSAYSTTDSDSSFDGDCDDYSYADNISFHFLQSDLYE